MPIAWAPDSGCGTALMGIIDLNDGGTHDTNGKKMLRILYQNQSRHPTIVNDGRLLIGFLVVMVVLVKGSDSY